MLHSTHAPTGHRILWTIPEQGTETDAETASTSSTRSSYVSAETDLLRLDAAQYFTNAQNIAANRGVSIFSVPSDDAPARASPPSRSPSNRLSNGLIPQTKFSAWTRFRTNFIPCSPKLLQHRLASEATRTGPKTGAGTARKEAEIAAVLLKTITVLATAAVHKLGNVHAVLTREECWLRDNIQATVDMFETLSEDQGYAQKSKDSTKRYLYENAGRALRHLKAMNDDQAIVEARTSHFQT